MMYTELLQLPLNNSFQQQRHLVAASLWSQTERTAQQIAFWLTGSDSVGHTHQLSTSSIAEAGTYSYLLGSCFMPRSGFSLCLRCASLDEKDRSLSRFVILIATRAACAHVDYGRDIPYCATHRLCVRRANIFAGGMIVTDHAGCVRGSCHGAGCALDLAKDMHGVDGDVGLICHCAAGVGMGIFLS